jgi:hypothetical protein
MVGSILWALVSNGSHGGIPVEGHQFLSCRPRVVLDICQSPAVRLELLMNALVECWDRVE